MSASEHDTATPSARKPRSWRRRLLGHPLTHLVLALTVLSLVQGFLVKVYSVPSGSMEHTLEVGDRILVNRTAFLFREPVVGDVVVFTTPEGWHDAPTVVIDSPLEWAARMFGEITGIGPAMSMSMVKRIVAGPGQVIGCCGPDGQITVDGVPLEAPETGVGFVGATDGSGVPGADGCAEGESETACGDAFTVPDGEYVLLGDNRPGSSDSLSQCYGPSSGIDFAECVRTAQRDDLVGAVFAVAFPKTRGIS